VLQRRHQRGLQTEHPRVHLAARSLSLLCLSFGDLALI
jgi:hypothetical protein